jgi:hypothetical protein
VVKLADTLLSKRSGEIREGSSPSGGTIKIMCFITDYSESHVTTKRPGMRTMRVPWHYSSKTTWDVFLTEKYRRQHLFKSKKPRGREPQDTGTFILQTLPRQDSGRKDHGYRDV